MNNCSNCAWYCHWDRKCYGNDFLLSWGFVGTQMDSDNGVCSKWTFDGLIDEEREDCILMAKETK